MLRILAIVAFGYVIFSLVRRAVLSIQQRRFAKARGCGETKKWNSGWFGLKEWINILKAAKAGGHIRYFASRHDNPKDTTLGVNVFGQKFTTTIEPENIKYVLATGFKDFIIGEPRRSNFTPLLGDGIFTLDGPGWEHSRAMLKPQFARTQISDLPALEVHVQRLMRKLTEGETIDLRPLFFALTLDSATEFLFGQSVDSLLPFEERAQGPLAVTGNKDFAGAFDNAQEWIMFKVRFLRIGRFIRSKDFQDAINTVHELADHFVDIALNPEKRTEEAGNRAYVFLYEFAKETTDRKALRDQMLNILLAGRDTTAGLLGFALHALVKQPRVFQKLQSEINECFGKNNRPTFESLKDCTYLRYFLNEVLRLYPSVPSNGRQAVRDTVLPTGGGLDGTMPVFVPKGTRVTYAVYAMHRRTDLYGEDALEFRPERWGEEACRKIGWGYLPFNGGPRICLGQQYALTEAGYTIVRLLQEWTFDDAEPGVEVKLHANMTMSPERVLVRPWKKASSEKV